MKLALNLTVVNRLAHWTFSAIFLLYSVANIVMIWMVLVYARGCQEAHHSAIPCYQQQEQWVHLAGAHEHKWFVVSAYVPSQSSLAELFL